MFQVCITRDVTIETNAEQTFIEAETVDICAIVSFVACQVDQEYRNAADEIVGLLMEEYVKEASKDEKYEQMQVIKGKLENHDLINNIERVRKVLALRFGYDIKAYLSRDLMTVECITKVSVLAKNKTNLPRKCTRKDHSSTLRYSSHFSICRGQFT